MRRTHKIREQFEAIFYREADVRLYALLENLYELLFTEAAMAEDGTVVRRTVTRPAQG